MALERRLVSSLEANAGKNFNDRVRVAVQVNKSIHLSCPLQNMSLWNMHPKVYLAIDASNEAVCPYCSTHYISINE